jgi:GT2 family glycosyltransferase
MEIIIPHIARMDLTKTCLDSIPDANTVYLIDNSRFKEVRKYSLHRSFVKWIRPKETPISAAASWNLGMRHAKDEWVLIANNDIIFRLQSWKVIEKALEEIKGPSIFLSECPWSCFVISKKMWEELPFDEDFAPAGGEDDDYIYRLSKAGYKWVRRNMGIYHLEGGHNTRVPNTPQMVKLFKQKHGMMIHCREYKEIVGKGRWTPRN